MRIHQDFPSYKYYYCFSISYCMTLILIIPKPCEVITWVSCISQRHVWKHLIQNISRGSLETWGWQRLCLFLFFFFASIKPTDFSWVYYFLEGRLHFLSMFAIRHKYMIKFRPMHTSRSSMHNFENYPERKRPDFSFFFFLLVDVGDNWHLSKHLGPNI